MRNKDNVFSFELNESLHFEKGQEVSEMVSISLEPEISIQSFQDYVSIRGVIELEGEYVKKSDDSESIVTDKTDDINFIEKVAEKDDYTIFSHRFPVEISVPVYRVHHMDDISVHIETFDYELPTGDQLILTSTIEILGIHSEEAPDPPVSSQLPDEPLEQAKGIEGESFEFELKPEKFEKQLMDIDQKEAIEEKQVDPEAEKIEEPIEESKKENNSRWKHKQSQSLEEFMQTNDEENEEISIPVGEKIQDDVKKLHIVDEQSEEEEIDDEDEVEESPSEEPLHINYLDDLFTDKESEDKYTKMRICIVQEKDTLETISERYEIPKLQLLKQNRLEDDQLSEGQLLSIPIKSEE